MPNTKGWQSDTCAKNLLDSYHQEGGISVDGMPAVTTIHAILVDTRRLLYPGYYSPYHMGLHSTHPNEPHEWGALWHAHHGKDPHTIAATQDHLHHLYTVFQPVIEYALACGCHSNDEKQQAATQSHAVVSDWLGYLPRLRKELKQDIEATFAGDPAAQSHDDIILSYPGFQATMVYRLAHFLHQRKVPLIPRMMTEWAHSATGIDIHPGATIGHSFCIDHGTGVVIGETAVIGHHVKLYHGVTLGALSVKKSSHPNAATPPKKRHPTLGNHVVVYAHATILGGHTEIGDHCTIGGNVWLTHSLPARSTCYLSDDYRQLLTSKTHPEKRPS